ncbi:MAG: hypothetical protein IJA10_12245 [Lachnospiraceae bacterium]|nr:hypothetical protein [Lachnospiraceae bacterium]
MRRSRRLDTLDDEFSVQNLQTYYEQERPYKHVEPPVYHPGYALHKKPDNAFQQRYYGKLYRMCVVRSADSSINTQGISRTYPHEGVAGRVSFLKS